MRRKNALLAIAALAVAAVAFPALTQSKPEARPVIVQRLLDCRKTSEDAARLACYDQAAEALDSAEAKGDILVVDREQARTVRRQAFGLSLPSLSLFDKGESEEELNTVLGQVQAARQDATGRWIVKLDSGASWIQVDTTVLRKVPKAGMPVKVRKAALGSYVMNIGDQHAVRVRRTE